MESCIRCERESEEVKLVDAIYNREMVKICEECAISENMPIIRKPSTNQLKESEKPYSVGERMKRMAGIAKNEIKKEEFKPAVLTLDRLRKPKDYKSILNNRFQQAKTANQPLNLVDNYQWYILMARKNRKISRKQLADAIGETENTVRLIEEKFLPDDALRVINKIEQYFGIPLKQGSKPVAYIDSKPAPARIIKIDSKVAGNVTIDDLRKMKEARESVVSSDVPVAKEKAMIDAEIEFVD
jgi:ribosome-binding protein aMBF1 (putative translation factor)